MESNKSNTMKDGSRVACALVPMSADPITYGHIDLLRQAAQISDRTILLICQNDNKQNSTLFSLGFRRQLAREALLNAGLADVEVLAESSLLVDVVLRENADCIIRGVRNEDDSTQDDEQVVYHALVWPEMKNKFRFLPARPELRHVSSSLAKAFVTHGLDVSALVPANAQAVLEERISQRWLIGVTGGIGCGKTFVCRKLVRQLQACGIAAHHVSFDEIVRQLYEEDTPGASTMRNRLDDLFDDTILSSDRKKLLADKLRENMFASDVSDDLRKKAHEIMEPHFWRKYREQVSGLRGMVFVEWALLAEMGMGRLVCHRNIIVESPDRKELLQKRSLPQDLADRIMQSQFSDEERLQKLCQGIQENAFGWVIRYMNHLHEPSSLELLAAELQQRLPQAFKPNKGVSP